MSRAAREAVERLAEDFEAAGLGRPRAHLQLVTYLCVIAPEEVVACVIDLRRNVLPTPHPQRTEQDDAQPDGRDGTTRVRPRDQDVHLRHARG